MVARFDFVRSTTFVMHAYDYLRIGVTDYTNNCASGQPNSQVQRRLLTGVVVSNGKDISISGRLGQRTSGFAMCGFHAGPTCY